MQNNFPACLAFTLKFEGGRVDDPRDPGGRTNEGVTQTTYNAYRTKTGLAVRSVYAMADAERDAIYADGFWSKVGANALPVGVDLAAFDYGVNSGPARAKKAVPGDLRKPVEVVRSICAKRSSFLHTLRTWAAFGHGWGARVAACEALGVKMALNAEAGVAPIAPAPAAVKATLQTHAAEAASSAVTMKRASSVSVVAGGSPVATALASPSHIPVVAIAIIAGVAILTAAYLVWRASHHAARAAAYSDLAKGA